MRPGLEFVRQLATADNHLAVIAAAPPDGVTSNG